MKYYVRPTASGENFTAGKLYKIQRCFGSGRVVVLNDAKEEIIVRCDGIVSARLDWRGKFERVNIPDEQEAMASAVRTAKYAMKIGIKRGEGWRIQKSGVAITSNNFVPADLKYNHKGKSVSVKEACELLDELKEILRCSDWSELKAQAKVSRALSDALIKLQK